MGGEAAAHVRSGPQGIALSSLGLSTTPESDGLNYSVGSPLGKLVLPFPSVKPLSLYSDSERLFRKPELFPATRDCTCASQPTRQTRQSPKAGRGRLVSSNPQQLTKTDHSKRFAQ